MLCMGVGVCGASVGIKSRYYDKLALFYLSCRYDELRKVLQFESTNPESPKYESNQSHVKHFEKVWNSSHFVLQTDDLSI